MFKIVFNSYPVATCLQKLSAAEKGGPFSAADNFCKQFGPYK